MEIFQIKQKYPLRNVSSSNGQKCRGHMGTGSRIDLYKGNKYLAAPTSYFIPSVFDMNKFKSKGVGMRISRKDLNPDTNQNIGPDKYYPNIIFSSNQTKSPSYSINSRPKQSILITREQLNLPEPGRYNQNILNCNSKYKKNTLSLIQPTTTKTIQSKNIFIAQSIDLWKKTVINQLQ